MDIIIPIIAFIIGVAWLKIISSPEKPRCPIRRPDKRARVIIIE